MCKEMLLSFTIKVWRSFSSLSKGFKDDSDRVSSSMSFIIFFSCMVINFFGLYVYNPISCFDSAFDDVPVNTEFPKSTCFTPGIYNFPKDRTLTNYKEWADDPNHLIQYYFYMGTILLILCLFYYLPQAIVGMIHSHEKQEDLEDLLNVISETQFTPDCDFFCNKMAEKLGLRLRKNNSTGCSPIKYLKQISKGKLFTCLYLVRKVLQLCNGFVQLHLINKIFGSEIPFISFGKILFDQILDRDSESEKYLFPYKGYCLARNVIALGAKNNYVLQCSLPMNLMNDKIVLLLWSFALLVMSMTTISLVLWIKTLTNRFALTSKLLKSENASMDNLNNFQSTHLSYDGSFVLEMIHINAGEIAAKKVAVAMFRNFKEMNNDKFIDKHLDDLAAL